MNCNKFSEIGLLYFYNELEPAEKTEFENHLKECETCRTELNELKNISELYESLPKEEPSQVVLKKILARVKKREFKIRVPAIKLFQAIPRPAFVLPGILAVIIFAIVGYFIYQKPKPYLEWESGMGSKIEVIEDRIYDLEEESEILVPVDKILLNMETRIQEIHEKIKSLEKELQVW